MNLPNKDGYFANYKEPGLRNMYINVEDSISDRKIYLGTWHLLPWDLINASLTEKDFDFDEALTNGNYSTVLYFHGAGEARSYELKMYQVLRRYFHVIAIDYRSMEMNSSTFITQLY